METSRFGVVLGSDLANTFELSVGDQIKLVLPQVSVSLAGSHLTTNLEVVGIFDLGLDVDKNLLVMHVNDLRKLKRQKKIDGLSIKTKIFLKLLNLFEVIYLKNLSTDTAGNSLTALYRAIGTQSDSRIFNDVFSFCCGL